MNSPTLFQALVRHGKTNLQAGAGMCTEHVIRGGDPFGEDTILCEETACETKQLAHARPAHKAQSM